MAIARAWQCTNDIEVSCAAQKCTASESFTPTSISLQETGRMEICAYSGCWRGRGTVTKSKGAVYFSAPKLKWSGVEKGEARAIVALDTLDRLALVKVAGFAMPVHCKKGS